MKNLENYGVLEMNKKEIKETEGGWWTLKEWNQAVGDFNDKVYRLIDTIMP
ncbi:MAG: hypothetical protein PHW92_03860 [Lutibacter sp.]|nr:hypothetical protein [Lutibacter sp.]